MVGFKGVSRGTDGGTVPERLSGRFCTLPHDCLLYNAPGHSRYERIRTQGEVSPPASDNSGRLCAHWTKTEELSLPDLAKLAVGQFRLAHRDQTVLVNDGQAVCAGSGSVAVTGLYGAAAVDSGSAAYAGDYGAARADNRGLAQVGQDGAAVAGDFGIAYAGNNAVALTGEYGIACAGTGGIACARACGAAETAGGGCAVARAGGRAHAGCGGIALALGRDASASGAVGALLVLTEHDAQGRLLAGQAVLVDGRTILADTDYILRDGRPIPAP